MAGFDRHSVCARCRDKKTGEDPCIKDKPCSHCELLTEDQKLRLATPAYQKKKEKRELKAKAEESSSTLVDPALVSVTGLVKDNWGKSSEEVSTTPVGVKAKKMDKNSGTQDLQRLRNLLIGKNLRESQARNATLHRLSLLKYPLIVSWKPWILGGWRGLVV